MPSEIQTDRPSDVPAALAQLFERVLDGESKYAVAKTTAISRRTLSRILADEQRLRLYVDAEAIDERMANALDDTAINAVDLPEGFEERIRSVGREEVDRHD